MKKDKRVLKKESGQQRATGLSFLISWEEGKREEKGKGKGKCHTHTMVLGRVICSTMRKKCFTKGNLNTT